MAFASQLILFSTHLPWILGSTYTCIYMPIYLGSLALLSTVNIESTILHLHGTFDRRPP